MSRNRKHGSVGVKLAPALKAFALCLLFGGTGVGYVWQKEQINILHDRMKAVEQRHQRLRADNEQLSRVLAGLQSPAQIEARIKRIDLGMVAPQPDQIVRLVEVVPTPQVATESSKDMYAAQRSGFWGMR
jgi:cell division protein FtsB